MALHMLNRSDGKEIMVDNRYLKANYPLLVMLSTSDTHSSLRDTIELEKWEGWADWVKKLWLVMGQVGLISNSLSKFIWVNMIDYMNIIILLVVTNVFE